jgi:hypothetical protein
MIAENLKQLESTLLSKGHDYGKEFEVFEFAADYAQIDVDKVFMVMIAIKVARLRNLQGKEAKNESIADTLKDLAGYSIIYKSFLDKNLGTKE